MQVAGFKALDPSPNETNSMYSAAHIDVGRGSVLLSTRVAKTSNRRLSTVKLLSSAFHYCVRAPS
jgi:hypothetical protein